MFRKFGKGRAITEGKAPTEIQVYFGGKLVGKTTGTDIIATNTI